MVDLGCVRSLTVYVILQTPNVDLHALLIPFELLEHVDHSILYFLPPVLKHSFRST